MESLINYFFVIFKVSRPRLAKIGLETPSLHTVLPVVDVGLGGLRQGWKGGPTTIGPFDQASIGNLHTNKKDRFLRLYYDKASICDSEKNYHFCSYMTGYFQNFSEEIFIPSLFKELSDATNEAKLAKSHAPWESSVANQGDTADITGHGSSHVMLTTALSLSLPFSQHHCVTMAALSGSTRNASTLVSCSIIRWSRSSHYSCSWAFKAVKQLVAVKLYLTTGVSIVSCERNFYNLRLIKSYLRFWRKSVISCGNSFHRKWIYWKLDFGLGDIISDFALSKARRVKLELERTMAGPALSRLDRLLPIGPRARPTNLRKMTRSIEAACVAPEWGHSFFKRGARC